MAADARVAPHVLTRIVAPKIHLVALDLPFSPPPDPSTKAPPGEWLSRALDAMRVGPVVDGFAIVAPPANSDGPLTLCRTTSTGELVSIVDAEIDAPTPASEPARWPALVPDAEYEIFWSYNKEAFRQAIADRRQSRSRGTFDGFFPFRFRPSKLFDGDRQPHFNLHPALDERLGLLLEAVEADEPAGYLTRTTFIRAHLDASALGGGRFVLARRPAIDAIRVAELAVGAYLDIRWQALKPESVFSAAATLADRARAGRIDWSKVGTTSSDDAEAFAAYARRCAEAGVDRDLFIRATTIDDAGLWRAAATEIQEKHPSVGRHPSEGFRRASAEFSHHHFDFYRFGVQNGPQCRWRRYAAQVQSLRERQGRDLEAMLRSFVATYASWGAALADIGGRLPPACGPDERDEYHLRYVSMMGALDIQAADTLDQSEIPRLQPYLGWLGTTLDKGGGSVDFILNDARRFFTNTSELERLGPDFDRMAKKIVGIARAAGVKLVSRKTFDGHVIELDMEAKLATVKSAGGDTVGSFGFEVVKRTVGKGEGKREIPKDLKRVRTLVARTLHNESELPKVLGAAGSYLGLGLSWDSLSRDLQTKDNAVVWGRLGQNTVQALDSTPALLSFFRLKGMSTLAEKAASRFALKPVGAGLEGAFNVYEGAPIVWALVRGERDPSQDVVTNVKGIALFATGAVGIAALVHGASIVAAGAAVTFAAPAFAVAALAVAVGGIVTMGCDIAQSYSERTGTKELEDALVDASITEFGADLVGVSTLDVRYESSRTYELGKRFLEELRRALSTI